MACRPRGRSTRIISRSAARRSSKNMKPNWLTTASKLSGVRVHDLERSVRLYALLGFRKTARSDRSRARRDSQSPVRGGTEPRAQRTERERAEHPHEYAREAPRNYSLRPFVLRHH